MFLAMKTLEWSTILKIPHKLKNLADRLQGFHKYRFANFCSNTISKFFYYKNHIRESN